MQLFLLFMVIFIANSSADCGCLKCSKHLQGVDIPGPDGSALKIVFPRPKQCDDDGRSRCYTARIEAPLVVSEPGQPRTRDSYYQQKYIPEPCCDCGGGKYSPQIQAPYPTQQKPCRLLNNLKYRCDTVLVPSPQCAEACQHCCSETCSSYSATSGRPHCCSGCDCRLHRSEPDYLLNNFNKNDEGSSCRARNKRSINAEDSYSHSSFVSDRDDHVKIRSKRDLAKSGYKFLMGMLPQFVREPLHHSIQGTYVPPEPTLKDKLDELKLKKLTANLKPNYHDYEKAQPSYFSPKKINHHFDNPHNQPKYFPGIYRQSKVFGTKKPPLVSYLSSEEEEVEPFFNTKYKYGSSFSPKFSLRSKQAGSKIEEAVLLRKLKKLNGNPYSASIKDQANEFLQDLIKPNHKRSKRAVGDLKRQKRTIILSSDEIDLPPQYEVEFVSAEDDGFEDGLEHLETSEEDPIVGYNSPFLRKPVPSSKRLFPFLPKPEVVIGKNVIKQAVRDELNAYHKKVEQEQKIKEIQTNMERRKQEASIIPHNPIFLLLTAPMKFLKHFRDINKGVNPVMTSLPKLVHTTKKYFRDFGKNFQKNCLNLASDVIGDFDHVPPQVVQTIQSNEFRRYRRECEDAREIDEELKRNYDENKINIKERTKQFEDEKPIGAALKPESILSAKESNNAESFVQDSIFFLNRNISSIEDAGHNETVEQDKVNTGKQKSLLDKFFHLVKELLDPNISLSPNDSTIENLSESEDVDVAIHTNSEPPIETNTEKLSENLSIVSAEKAAVVDSEEAVHLDGDAMELKSDLRNEEYIESSLEDQDEYECEELGDNPLLVYSEESGRSDSSVKMPVSERTIINLDTNKAGEVQKTTNKNIEDFIASNREETANNISKDKVNYTPEDSSIQELKHKLAPIYSIAFENSKENQNFRLVPEAHVRKKRYVVKVVDDGELQEQVEEYLTQKMDDQFSYLKPLQDYHEKVNKFLAKLHSGSEDVDATDQDEMDYDDFQPKRKILQIKKVKPRVIIDNKGIPFMEYDGFKRPLLLKSKYNLKHSLSVEKDKSSEETGNKIATLIARAKEDSEVVGSEHKNINGEQIIKERISFLLEEIDQLVHLSAEDYDEIFEDLIKIQNIKTSIEQDWKRILIDNRVSDINAKIRILSKFKDLQHIKDVTVKNIAKALEKNDNEFVRCQLVKSLVRLQKLQSLITSVAEDFEQHLKTKTSFNTKKEIKFVDFLSELNFVYANTRNDLVKKLCQDRDVEGQKNIVILHKLKKLLATSQADSEKFQQVVKLVWEMKHMEKLQKQTIEDMNKKLSKKFKIKKELKILFDLQKRFEDCVTELNQLLGNIVIDSGPVKFGPKKDIKSILAEMKQKHEERLLKIKGKSSGLQKLKKS